VPERRHLIRAVFSGAAALVGAGVAYQLAGTWRDARRSPAPGRLVSAGARRLHLHVIGQGGPLVVLEAGIAASSLSWQLVQPQVARFTQVCAYDRAGLGWSGPGSRSATGQRSIAELRSALRAAGLQPPYVLVGHSFGAYLVRLFAALHADDVAGMVLVDPLEPEDWYPVSAADRRRLTGGILFSRIGAALAAVGVVRFALHRFLRGDRRLPRAVLGSFGPEATHVVERIVGQVAKLPPRFWPAVQAHWSRPQSFLAMSRAFAALPDCAREVIALEAALDAGDGAPARPFRDVPVIVMSGANAPPDCVERHRRTAQSSARGAHRIASTGGHWVQLDVPTEVVRAIEEVVKAVRS